MDAAAHRGTRHPAHPLAPVQPAGQHTPGHAVVETTGDGNCLFRALAMAVCGDMESHAVVRTKLVHFQLKTKVLLAEQSILLDKGPKTPNMKAFSAPNRSSETKMPVKGYDLLIFLRSEPQN